MFGEVCGAVYYPVIEAGSVIIGHRRGIVTVVLINQADFFNLIIVSVKFIENLHHILCNGFVAN